MGKPALLGFELAHTSLLQKFVGCCKQHLQVNLQDRLTVLLVIEAVRVAILCMMCIKHTAFGISSGALPVCCKIRHI